MHGPLSDVSDKCRARCSTQLGATQYTRNEYQNGVGSGNNTIDGHEETNHKTDTRDGRWDVSRTEAGEHRHNKREGTKTSRPMAKKNGRDKVDITPNQVAQGSDKSCEGGPCRQRTMFNILLSCHHYFIQRLQERECGRRS